MGSKTLNPALALSAAEAAAINTDTLRWSGKQEDYPAMPKGRELEARFFAENKALIDAGAYTVETFHIPFSVLVPVSLRHPGVAIEVVDTTDADDGAVQIVEIQNGAITVTLEKSGDYIDSQFVSTLIILEEVAYQHAGSYGVADDYLDFFEAFDSEQCQLYGPRYKAAAEMLRAVLKAPGKADITLSVEGKAKIAAAVAAKTNVFLKAEDYGLARAGSKDRVFALNSALNKTLNIDPSVNTASCILGYFDALVPAKRFVNKAFFDDMLEAFGWTASAFSKEKRNPGPQGPGSFFVDSPRPRSQILHNLQTCKAAPYRNPRARSPSIFQSSRH